MVRLLPSLWETMNTYNTTLTELLVLITGLLTENYGIILSDMDFKLILEKLLTSFEKDSIRYALIGGMALGAWGVPRGTVDIDFLVNRDDMEKVDGIMRGMKYECKYRSENVSQYVSCLKIYGEVDFLHAFRTPSLSVLQRTVNKDIFNGAISIKVLKVEDLIGFKLQGMTNDETRKALDLSDIESLMEANKTILEWEMIKEYFDLFECGDLFLKLKKRYGND